LIPGGSPLISIPEYFQFVSNALAQVDQEPIARIIHILNEARLKKKHIFILGNGGSSATASHIVNDLLKSTARPDMPHMRVICLADNTPTLTAYANDVAYEAIFSEQLVALADPGDVLVALSGSGNSPNVLRAMEKAKLLELTRIGLTGFDGGRLKDQCDVSVVVSSNSMQVIEDVHMVILHSIFLALC
jgi:D-sedoheptulose 7-phosphate isomerase